MYATAIRSGRGIALATCLMMLGAQQSFAALVQDRCEGGKNDAAGKYAACVAKALKSLTTSGDTEKYDAAVVKCESKLVKTWDKLEAVAAAAGTSCPSTGDQSDIEDFVAACLEGVADAVAGGTLPVDVVTCGADLTACGLDVSDCQDDLATSESDLATCDADLADCLATPHIGLPKTGQTTCYNDAGTAIACAGTKQDGDLKAGVPFRYMDNGDGTITDRVTNLMWEKLSDDSTIHDVDTSYAGLTGAIAKVTTLNTGSFAGYSDWRLPNARELPSITDLGRFHPAADPVFNTNCTASCTVLTCSCTKNNIYVTSSTYFLYTPALWKVNFEDGDIYAGSSTDAHYVRAVRTVN